MNPTKLEDIKHAHWMEYCLGNNTDSLYFFDADAQKLVVISEGSGDNIDDEDLQNGYVDYWYCEVYSWIEGDIGGGIMLRKTLIADDNDQLGVIIRSLDADKDLFDGIGDMDLTQTFIMPEDGKALAEQYGTRATQIYRQKWKPLEL